MISEEMKKQLMDAVLTKQQVDSKNAFEEKCKCDPAKMNTI